MEKSNNITAEEYLEMRQSVGWSVFPLEQAAKGKEEFYKKFDFIGRPNEMTGDGMFQWIEG